MPPIRLILRATGVAAACAALSGCLVLGVTGAVVGTAGAVVGATAKGAGAVVGAVIPGHRDR